MNANASSLPGLTIILTTAIALTSGCIEADDDVDPETITLDLIESYERRGELSFLDVERRQAFQLTSADAEARFHEDLELAGLLFERDDTFRNVASNWIGQGSTTHSVAPGLDQWTFDTVNNSTRIKVAANVIGTVHHTSGATTNCDNSTSTSVNSCTIYTLTGSGYNYATGSHRACEKKTIIWWWDCTPWFQSKANNGQCIQSCNVDQCGLISDGCGGSINCGVCNPPPDCSTEGGTCANGGNCCSSGADCIGGPCQLF